LCRGRGFGFESLKLGGQKIPYNFFSSNHDYSLNPLPWLTLKKTRLNCYI